MLRGVTSCELESHLGHSLKCDKSITMLNECENCGARSFIGSPKCGCTRDEQLLAMNIKEKKRRKELQRQGRQVIVDLLKYQRR